MKRVHIAILDDGVNDQYFKDLNIASNLIVSEELNIEKRQNYNPSVFSHGSVCAAIIRKYCRSAAISSIKLLEKNKLGNKNKLVKAIEWCMDNEVNIINLSIGTVHNEDKGDLRDIINQAYKKGIIIVAANKNEDIITYPAYFNNVIGVKCDNQNMLKEGEFLYNFGSEDQLEITACGSYSLIDYSGESRKVNNCNSFAAPLITASVANLLETSPELSMSEVKRELWKQSLTYSPDLIFCEQYDNLEWIQNALIYNVNNRTIIEVDKMVLGAEKVINIRSSDLKESMNRIDEDLTLKDEILKKIDTIIIDIKGKVNESSYVMLEHMMKDIQHSKKNIVLLNDCIFDKKMMELLKYYTEITYIGSVGSFCTNFEAKKIKSEKPLIAIINYTDENLLQLLIALSEYFSKEDYFTTIFVNDLQGAYYGFKHFPVDHKMNFKMLREFICALGYSFNLNNSNLGIVGINTSRDELDYESMFAQTEDIDILVQIYQDSINYTYRNEISEERKAVKIINSSYDSISEFYNRSYIELLYKQILAILIG